MRNYELGLMIEGQSSDEENGGNQQDSAQDAAENENKPKLIITEPAPNTGDSKVTPGNLKLSIAGSKISPQLTPNIEDAKLIPWGGAG